MKYLLFLLTIGTATLPLHATNQPANPTPVISDSDSEERELLRWQQNQHLERRWGKVERLAWLSAVEGSDKNDAAVLDREYRNHYHTWATRTAMYTFEGIVLLFGLCYLIYAKPA